MTYFTAVVAARALVTKDMRTGLATLGCVVNSLELAKKYSGPVSVRGAHRVVLMCSVWVNTSPITSLHHPSFEIAQVYRKPRNKTRIRNVVRQR
jgi:hypothetical protein